MARAKRHFIPGHIRHITHRCHKREFLLRFAKDRQRYLQWLYRARKRYGLKMLDYVVTSNHIHLLVVDCGEDRHVIPRSMKVVAGRTGQEFNQRKNRRGAYWEDRYHATAMESGEHLARCVVYIDTNMVRAGVVSHPVEWPFGGYKEIRNPRRRNILIDCERLQKLPGIAPYDRLRMSHRGWVEEYLGDGGKAAGRQDEWTGSVAVGSRAFVARVKELLRPKVLGREIRPTETGYQLREGAARWYRAVLGPKNSDIGPENTHVWGINIE